MRKLLFFVVTLCMVAVSSSAQKKEHDQWDMYAYPTIGVTYSNLTKLDGDFKVGGVVGGGIEVYLLPRLTLDVEATFSMNGSKDYKSENPEVSSPRNAQINLINTDYIFHVYPTRHFNIFTGVDVGYIVHAKLGDEDHMDDLHRGVFSIPVGLGYNFGNFFVEARYNYYIKKMAKSEWAKLELGDAKMHAIWLKFGYKIQLF